MSMLKDFREFAVKGNVVDLAVAVIIGGAFGKIVDSLVKDIIMPVVGRIFGGLDFSNYYILLGNPPAGYGGPMTYEALTKAGVPLLAYGNFITIVINFVILAFVIFWMVKQIMKAKAKFESAPRRDARGAARGRRAAARDPRPAQEVALRRRPASIAASRPTGPCARRCPRGAGSPRATRSAPSSGGRGAAAGQGSIDPHGRL